MFAETIPPVAVEGTGDMRLQLLNAMTQYPGTKRFVVRVNALAHTPAKPEPGPTPVQDAMKINGCFHTQPVRHIGVSDWELDKPGAGPAAGLSVSI
jgi:hypothetical protein